MRRGGGRSRRRERGSEDGSVWPSEDKGTRGIYRRIESQGEASVNAFISRLTRDTGPRHTEKGKRFFQCLDDLLV